MPRPARIRGRPGDEPSADPAHPDPDAGRVGVVICRTPPLWATRAAQRGLGQHGLVGRSGHRLVRTRCRRRDPGLSARRLAGAHRHRAAGRPLVGVDAVDDLDPGFGVPAACMRRLGPARTAFSCVVPVPADGLERCVPDRRHLQSVRVLRSDAHRLLRPAAQRWARVADAGGPALRGVQRLRVDVVPDCAGPAVRCLRHAQHGRAVAAHCRSAGAGCAVGKGHAGLVAAGVLQQGRVAAAVSVAAGNLFARTGGGGRIVRHHDQGRVVCNAAGVLVVVWRRCRRAARLRSPCAVVAGHRDAADGRVRGDGRIAAAGDGVVPGGVFGSDPVHRVFAGRCRRTGRRAVLPAAQQLCGRCVVHGVGPDPPPPRQCQRPQGSGGATAGAGHSRHDVHDCRGGGGRVAAAARLSGQGGVAAARAPGPGRAGVGRGARQ